MRALFLAAVIACLIPLGCLEQSIITGLDASHSSLLITPINQPYRAGAASQAILNLRRSDDTAVAGAPVQFEAQNCSLQNPSASSDANGMAVVTVTPSGPQGCLIAAAATFEGISIPVVPVAAVNFYLPADGNAAVLPGQLLDMQATARNATGLVDTTFTGTVHISSTDGNATLPIDYTFVPADYGNKIWLAGLVLRSSGMQTIRAANAATGEPLQPDVLVDVAGSQAASVQMIASSGVTAGAPNSVQLRVLDGYGTPATTYTGTLQFTSSDANATLPAAVTFTAADAGSRQVDGFVFRAAGVQTLQVQDTASGALSARTQIVVAAAAADHLGLQMIGVTAAGLPLSATVVAQDPFGNGVATAAATLHIITSDPCAIVPADTLLTATDGGRKSLTGLTLFTAGNQNVTVSDLTHSLAPAGLPVTVVAAAAADITLSTALTSEAGAPQDVWVQAYDAYGNFASGFTGTVSFTGSDPRATYPTNYRFDSHDAGQHLFAAGLTFRTAATQALSVTVAGTGQAASQGNIVVSPADANQLLLSGLPSNLTACTAYSPTLTVTDAYTNIATQYQGTVTFSSTDANATVPPPVTFMASDNGTLTFAGAFSPYAATASTLTASDGTLSGALTFNVSANAPQSLVLSGLAADAAINAPQSVKVSILDACANLVTSATDVVHFASTDPCSYLPLDHTYTATDAGVYSTSVAFANLRSQTVTVSDSTQGSVTPSTATTSVYYPCTAYGPSLSTDNAGLANIPPGGGTALNVTVALRSDDSPLATWIDTRSGEPRTYVALWNTSSAAWGALGSSLANLGLNSVPGTTGPPSIAVHANAPWVAWPNTAVAATGSSVLMESYNASAWSGAAGNGVDSSAAPGLTGSNATAQDSVQIVVTSAGVPMVAWRNKANNSLHLRSYTSSVWGGLGSSDVVTAGPEDANDAYGLALILDGNDTPYVAWQSNASGTDQIYLATWNGSAWVGLAGSNTSSISSGGASAHPALAVDSANEPWLVWETHASSGNLEIYGMHWNGTAWSAVNGSASNGGISATSGSSQLPSVAVDANNIAIVAWQDSTPGKAAIYLKYQGPSTWTEINASASLAGISNQFSEAATNAHLVLDSQGRPVVAFTCNNAALLCRWVNAQGQ